MYILIFLFFCVFYRLSLRYKSTTGHDNRTVNVSNIKNDLQKAGKWGTNIKF